MTSKVVLSVVLNVCALGSAVAQQQSAEQKSQGDGVQLQRRQDPVKRVGKVPPPESVKAPEKLDPAKAANGNGIYQVLRARSASGQSSR